MSLHRKCCCGRNSGYKPLPSNARITLTTWLDNYSFHRIYRVGDFYGGDGVSIPPSPSCTYRYEVDPLWLKRYLMDGSLFPGCGSPNQNTQNRFDEVVPANLFPNLSASLVIHVDNVASYKMGYIIDWSANFTGYQPAATGRYKSTVDGNWYNVSYSGWNDSRQSHDYDYIIYEGFNQPYESLKGSFQYQSPLNQYHYAFAHQDGGGICASTNHSGSTGIIPGHYISGGQMETGDFTVSCYVAQQQKYYYWYGHNPISEFWRYRFHPAISWQFTVTWLYNYS